MTNDKTIGDTTLYLGDCREVMPQLSIKADMCIVDPPYGMGFQSNRAKDGPRHNKIIGPASIKRGVC